MSPDYAPRTPAHKAEFCLRAHHHALIEMINEGVFDEMFVSLSSHQHFRLCVARLQDLVLAESLSNFRLAAARHASFAASHA